ncbi:MAG: ABC transporter substrate-binding protein [Mangrovicoccus sp.]|nr:ABC transporter substrate-binding protein [Mangrovicoccus sp.]
MSGAPVSAGFIPLVDAAPLIVAREIGFAEEEGVALSLTRAPSWSTLRDMLAFGQVDAAHMLSPVPVATALGLGGLGVHLDAVAVMSVNGNVIGVSRPLAARLRAEGHDFGFADAAAAGQALVRATGKGLRFGVPFPFSMHAELVYAWLGALGLKVPDDIDVRTVPPPLMARALAADEIDAFCVGEPWGSIAVEQGFGELLLPGTAIWGFAPEKVLAARNDWTTAEPELSARLIRALWRSARWLAQPGALSVASEVLARPDYLDMSAEIVERALTGRLSIAPQGELRSVRAFLEFHDGAAGFPWRTYGDWIALRLAARSGLDRAAARRAGRAVFRSDLYRSALAPLGADLPGASEKVLGAIRVPTAVASLNGRLILQPDAFFDRAIFDPAESR